MLGTTKLSPNGQLVIPKKIREAMKLTVQTELVVFLTGKKKDTIEIKRASAVSHK